MPQNISTQMFEPLNEHQPMNTERPTNRNESQEMTPTDNLRFSNRRWSLRALPTTEVLRPLPPLPQGSVRLSVTPQLRSR